MKELDGHELNGLEDFLNEMEILTC